MASTDESFPRGGFKISASEDQGVKKPQKQENLFGNVQPTTKKSKGKKKRQKQQDEVEATSVPEFINKTDSLTAVSADTLSIKKIHEGMSVLACVTRLNTMNVAVELPGRCFGEILVQNISATYTKLITDAVKADGGKLPSLDNVLQVGTFLPVKVIQIENDNKLRIFLTCNPAEINEHFKHPDFTKHMLVWGAIKEKSDHGYLIDLGVKNCRAHLPFDAVDAAKEYSLGQVLYMIVTKSVSSKEATTLTLSATQAAFDKTTESMGTSIDKVIPGMQVEFLVQKQLKDGLQGQYFDECTGFINDLYLAKSFDSAKKYKEFTAIKARLLYVHPVSKLGYFTLKSLNEKIPEKKTKLPIGAWILSTVAGKAGSGLIVKLSGGQKGFITHKRLLKSVNMKDREGEDLATLIANKFPVGVARHCTILDYNHTERLYICTFERITDIMNVEQLKIAQTVKGTIKEINDHGLVIMVGKLQAFAPKDNLSNVMYSENIRKQFKVGQEVNAKIWNLNIEKKEIILTLKPDLLSSNIQLSSYEGLSLSEQYPGVVIHVKQTGVLLLFYGGVKGWLPVRNIPQLGNKDARNEFYRGQIIKARCEVVDGDRLTLTLNLPKKKKVPVGKIIVKPKICEITDEGIYVMIGDIKAFVPKEQLAVEGLGKLLLSTYKVNQTLDEELICVIDSNPPVLSVREYVVHKREQLKIPSLPQLAVNVVMRGIYKEKNTISIPMKLHPGEFRIDDNGLKAVDRYESISAQVAKRQGKGKILWSVGLNKVFGFSFMETVNYLDQYLEDIARLRKRYLLTGNPLVDLEIGATVDCVVNQVDLQRGCSVSVLPMNCQGLVAKQHCPNKLKPGTTVKGKVLWVNYQLKYAGITLKPQIMQKINDKQGKAISNLPNENVIVRILHANRNVAVGVLREDFNSQLVYLPVKLHENDFTPKIDYYDALIDKEEYCKVIKMKSGRLLGVTVPMLESFKKKLKMYNTKIITLRNNLKKDEIKDKKKQVKNNKEDKMEIKEEDEGIASSEDIKSETEMVTSENDSEAEEIENNSEVEEEDDDDSEMEEVANEAESEENEKDSEAEEENDCELEENENNSETEENQTENDSESDSEETKTLPAITPEIETKKKRKLVEEEPQETSSKKKKKKKAIEPPKPTNPLKPNKSSEQPAVLSGMSSFFEEEAPITPKEESDDEDTSLQQKKKLTPAERLQKAKDEEARLRKIENDLADSSLLPQNAEQFDRALLGNPDDSELWTRYIAFHAQSTEFDKARAVARRAIERISFTAMQDRLNVWLAYLNFENMYGTKDSFQTLFEEATRCNDTLTIYLETIKMMAEMSKFVEMEEKIKKARGKFKQELQMWLEIGKVYYTCGKFSEARKLKDKALLTLIDKKSQMQLLVQYAIMEFVHGESNQGEALFETILQADPKRVDIWCTYVDQLIKKDKIDVARNVLSRAVGQKLAYKKMRTLFKKYHAFETTHGDEETLAHVTNLLREYSDK